MRIEIDDPLDPRIDVFQGLRDHTLRQVRERPDGDMAGVFIAEGDVVVERALRAGYRLESMLVDAKRTKPFPAAIPPDVPVYACGPEVLVRITGYHLHRGALACFRRRPLLDFETAVEGARTVAVMENTNNPTNLGVVLRCAAALGIEAFFIDPTCSDPLYRRCGRVSMGEAYLLPYTRLDHFPEGLAPLRQAGFQLIALTPTPDAVPLDDVKLDPDDRVALMLGAEGPGLTDGTLGAADLHVRIPMAGLVDSINVGSAAAVAFYGIGLARKR
ncbi:MAG: RNA methyltransferase [Acidimicrobiia bacterium]|nr:RNA methyltransferase [Acidimicrobiia bacterium]